MLKKSLFTILLCSSLFGIEFIIDKSSDLNMNVFANGVINEGTKKGDLAIDIVNGYLRDNKLQVLTDSSTDPRKGRMWQDNIDAKNLILDWVKARKYCKKLKLGGFSDWYLPSMGELESIVDFRKDNPAIREGFVHTSNEGYYWSSSSSVSKPTAAWIINFDKGSSNYKDKERPGHVRCIRRR